MKKYLSFAVSAIAILSLGSLTSCHDEDFDVSTTVLQERAFEQGFIKEFGKPSADQSFDFYAQRMQSLRQGMGTTRATMDDPIVDPTIGQSAVSSWLTQFTTNIKNNILKNGRNNASAGQNNFSLVSTGEFKIYAVHYGGAIEHNRDNAFHFGLGYYDANNDTTEIKIFDGYYQGSSDQVNPGYGAKVNLAPGTKFYFYIDYEIEHKYTYGGYEYNNLYWYSRGWNSHEPEEETYTRKYYTNANPSAKVHKQHVFQDGAPNWTDNIITDTYLDYPGAATLLYSTENEGKRYMIIGFEDAWHYSGCSGNNPDYDYNDIIFVLEGELPEPTSKRFFCEDLQSYDWDYNDVVFDLTSRGVVLRAVGGTLPVDLWIEDKTGHTWKYENLHELMWDNQPADEKTKHPVKTFVKGGRTYYKPIRVGANPGLSLEAVQLEPVWNYEDMDETSTFEGEGLALTDEQVINFANPKASETDRVGSIKLIVYKDIESRKTVTDAQVVDLDGSFHVIEPYQGSAPAIWSATSSVAWMKEMVKITDGYPDFYGEGVTTDPQTGGIPIWWSNVIQAKTYQFSGDVDPDRVGN